MRWGTIYTSAHTQAFKIHLKYINPNPNLNPNPKPWIKAGPQPLFPAESGVKNG